MRNKYFKIIISLLLFKSIIAYSLSDDNSELRMNGSFYSMDKSLIDKGYNLYNKNNELIYLYHGKKISAAQLYAPSMGRDEAIKLLIILKDSIKNAIVYLNEKELDKTDKNGMVEIDIFRNKGNYKLNLMDTLGNSVNYIFSLEKNIKLECSGEKDLICNKTVY